MSDHPEMQTDKPFQDLSEAPENDAIYVDLDPNDPELMKLRRESGDPTAVAEAVQP